MASRSDNLPRRFARIYTAAITDVMDELGLQRQTLPWAIQPLSADMRLAGYAFTARGRPYRGTPRDRDRKSTRLNSSHSQISYAVFCLKKKKHNPPHMHYSCSQQARRPDAHS